MTTRIITGRLESMDLAPYCQMCGTAKSYLEPAFDPDATAKTLCRDCRIGSAELLHDERNDMLKALQPIAAAAAEQMQLWSKWGDDDAKVAVYLSPTQLRAVLTAYGHGR